MAITTDPIPANGKQRTVRETNAEAVRWSIHYIGGPNDRTIERAFPDTAYAELESTYRANWLDVKCRTSNDAIARLQGGATALKRANRWRRGTRGGMRPRQQGTVTTLDAIGDWTRLVSRAADRLAAAAEIQRSIDDRPTASNIAH